MPHYDPFAWDPFDEPFAPTTGTPTPTISDHHHAEVSAAKHWHETAPETKHCLCPHCRVVTTMRKSRWQVGVYTCEGCGWKVPERWK